MFSDLAVVALEFAFMKTVILQSNTHTKWSKTIGFIKTFVAPGVGMHLEITSEQLDDSLDAVDDDIKGIDANFESLHTTLEENHSNGLYTELAQFVKSSLLTHSFDKLSTAACNTLKQLVADQIDPCNIDVFCSCVVVSLTRTIDVSLIEVCNDCCLVLSLPNKTFSDLQYMVDMFGTPEKLSEMHCLRWELFVSMLSYFYDEMGKTIDGLTLTCSDIKTHFWPSAGKDCDVDPRDACKVKALLAIKDAQVQQSSWIDTFVKPLLMHLNEHKSLHKCCSSRVLHCINAASPPAKKRRVDCKQEDTVTDAPRQRQEIGLDDACATPTTASTSDHVTLMALSELNHNTAVRLPPSQLHMLELHLTSYVWELFHDNLSLEDSPDHDMRICVHGKAQSPVTCKLKSSLKLIFAGNVTHIRPNNGTHCFKICTVGEIDLFVTGDEHFNVGSVAISPAWMIPIVKDKPKSNKSQANHLQQ